jgi:hypothetical protein
MKLAAEGLSLDKPASPARQRREVRLHPSPDRLKTVQPQQVESCGSQRGHGSSAIAAVAVGVRVQLAVSDPVPALDAPAVSNQLQQGFWGGAQAGENRGVA